MSDHLITRPARAYTCPSCGQPVLVATTTGITFAADPAALSITAEIAVLLSGRRTYDLIVSGLPRRMWLEWRDVARVKSGRRYAVVADHPCRIITMPDTGTEIRIPVGAPIPDEPPF